MNKKEEFMAKLARLAENSKDNGRKIAACILLGAMVTSGIQAQAAIPDTEMVETAHDDEAQLARTRADWKKLFNAYTKVDCNLDTDYVEALLEIEEYIEANYFLETSIAITVDDIIALRGEGINGISFAKMIEDYSNLDKSDSQAVAEFLALYGPYLADLHAHNYFTIVTLTSVIQDSIAYYTKQAVENSDQVRARYGFDTMQYGQTYVDNGEEKVRYAEINPDLSSVTLHYTADNALYDVNVDIVDSTDPVLGGGRTDYQNAYVQLLRELKSLYDLMNNGTYTEGTATYESFGVRGYTVTLTQQQVDDIIHNKRINDIIRNALKVIRRLNPAEAYEARLAAGEVTGVEVTEAGYGYYFDGLTDIKMTETYDEATNTYKVGMTLVFEVPQIELDRTLTLK